MTTSLLPTPSQLASHSVSHGLQVTIIIKILVVGVISRGWKTHNHGYLNHGTNRYNFGQNINSNGFRSGQFVGQNFRQQGNCFGGSGQWSNPWKIKSQLCYSFGHSAQQCPQLSTHNMQANAHLMCNTQSQSTHITLFPDTSANQHVTPANRDYHNRDMVFTLRSNPLPPHCLKLSWLHVDPLLLMFGTADLGILVHVF